MTSEYTPNFNLDLYANDDKPNLRDQYNSAVRKLDMQLKHTNDNVQANKTSVDMSVSKLNAQISDIKTNVSTNTQKIDKVTERVTALEQTKPSGFTNIVCIGDSWLEGYSSIGNFASWGTLLASKLKATGTNSYKGGCGFSVASNSINFKTLVTTASTSVESAEKVDCVVIGGGINDRKEAAATVQTAAAACVHEAVSKFPNAKIFVFPMMLAGRFISSATMAVLRAIERGCASVQSDRVVVFGECYDWIYDDSALHADSYHPNQAGQSVIADFMASVLTGGCPTCHNGDALIAGAESHNLNSGSFIRRSGTICSGYFGTTTPVTDGKPFISIHKGYSPNVAFLSYTNNSGEIKPINVKPVDADHIGFAPSYGDAQQIYCTAAWSIQDTE